jgi:hypothetical protein
VSTGASDLYLMPLQLGWHFTRADAVAGFALFAPTGRHTAGADDNVGKGLGGGGTIRLRGRIYARIFFTTSPCTSVRRKSRPWNRYVSFV